LTGWITVIELALPLIRSTIAKAWVRLSFR
jgi:hypothetical protein